MKILFTASESVPFVKTGGLADVVGALAPVLASQHVRRAHAQAFQRDSAGVAEQDDACLRF